MKNKKEDDRATLISREYINVLDAQKRAAIQEESDESWRKMLGILVVCCTLGLGIGVAIFLIRHIGGL